MIEALRANPQLDIDLVPVAVYWGRAPQKERSWFRLLFVEDWALTSRARKIMQVLFNGHNTIIEFDDPISLRSLLGAEIGVAVRGRRVARALRVLYAKHRAARIGPDLSHRRTIVTSVLRTRAVRAVVAQEMREKKLTRHQAILRAKRFAEEIAANYSHAFIRFMKARWHGCGTGSTTVLSLVMSIRWSARRRATRSSMFPATAATWTTCCCPMRFT